ncbi:hypothetical protein FBU30_006948 [Linnemannia zychae]|nr:hypothetical protein FBU30_006948 [Linnemannia zychae]
MIIKPILAVFLSLSAVTQAATLSKSETREVIERAMRRCGVPGMAVAVLYKNELIFAEGFGKRNGNGDPYTVQTLQPIGSLTKSFTAAAVGELVAEGKVDWDTTPINKYLPEFRLQDPILTSQLTFADLLSHRTPQPNDMIYWYGAKESRRDLIKRMRYTDVLTRKLGVATNYNNIMYAVAGEAAATVAGASYEDLVLNKVVRPLSLNHTGFSPMNMKKQQPDNYAMPFEAAESYEAALRGESREVPLDEIYMQYAPAGDMFSNVLDMVQWGKAVISLGAVGGKQVLNKTGIEETLKGHTFSYSGRRTPAHAPVLAYGMGWILDSYHGNSYYFHNGAISGFTANLVAFPDQDLIIASTTNIASISHIGDILPTYISEIVLDLPKSTTDWVEEIAVPLTKETYQQLAITKQGALPPKIPNKPATFADNLLAYVGKYHDILFGTFEIGLEERAVPGQRDIMEKVLTLKYNELWSTLEHYHYDSFVVTFTDVLVKFRALVTFSSEPRSFGDRKKKLPMVRLQIQELPAGHGISKRVFKRRHD